MPTPPNPAPSPAAYRSPGVADYVVCELAYDSRVAVPPGAGAFAAPEAAAPTRDALNRVLGRFDIKRVAPHFGEVVRKKDFTRRVADPVAAPGVSAPDAPYALAGFVQIVPEVPRQAAKLAEQLARAPGVWKAYLAPRPEPAGAAAR
ncbi:MAG: hypothetical protein K2X87_13710, partial [Gemmataceae bacterium]|nr:hypothetical protein [Gemmataceae bacterium]